MNRNKCAVECTVAGSLSFSLSPKALAFHPKSFLARDLFGGAEAEWDGAEASLNSCSYHTVGNSNVIYCIVVHL